MSDHDTLCPWRQAEESDSALGFLAGAAVCECDLIARVREDVGNWYVGAAQVHWDAGYAFGVNDAREAVMGAWREWTGDDNCTTHPCENCRTFGRAVSAINALQEKP